MNIKFKPNINFKDFLRYPSKTLFMLIGTSYSGKSSWIQQVADRYVPSVVVSTDEYIERLARSKGLSYLEIWGKDSYTEAYEYLLKMITYAIMHGTNVYWDQTNLSKQRREAKLAHFPGDWKKVAVQLRDPYGQSIYERHQKRTGKKIPWEVVEEQREKFERPSKDEGFDEIWVIENEGW